MPHGGRTSTTAEAYLLAAVGGSVDAIGLLMLGGLFVSHMSGNTAAMGEMFGHGNWAAALPHLFAVPVFLLGLFLGYLWMTVRPSYRRCGLILLSEALLLGIFTAGLFAFGRPEINTPGYFLLAAPPLLAMGLQNATLRQVGRSVFASTYVTGVLDMLGKSAAEYVKERDPAKRRDVLSAAGIWLCYALGAVGGGAGVLFWGKAILFAPMAVLLGLGVFFLRVGGQVGEGKGLGSDAKISTLNG